MEHVNDARDSQSQQIPALSTTMTTVTPITTQIVDDFEPDPKWEMTTLEKASYEDLYTGSNCIMSQSSVDDQMDKVIENIVELGGCQPFSQALVQDKEKAVDKIHREIIGERNPMEMIADVALGQHLYHQELEQQQMSSQKGGDVQRETSKASTDEPKNNPDLKETQSTCTAPAISSSKQGESSSMKTQKVDKLDANVEQKSSDQPTPPSPVVQRNEVAIATKDVVEESVVINLPVANVDALPSTDKGVKSKKSDVKEDVVSVVKDPFPVEMIAQSLENVTSPVKEDEPSEKRDALSLGKEDRVDKVTLISEEVATSVETSPSNKEMKTTSDEKGVAPVEANSPTVQDVDSIQKDEPSVEDHVSTEGDGASTAKNDRDLGSRSEPLTQEAAPQIKKSISSANKKTTLGGEVSHSVNDDQSLAEKDEPPVLKDALLAEESSSSMEAAATLVETEKQTITSVEKEVAVKRPRRSTLAKAEEELIEKTERPQRSTRAKTTKREMAEQDPEETAAIAVPVEPPKKQLKRGKRADKEQCTFFEAPKDTPNIKLPLKSRATISFSNPSERPHASQSSPPRSRYSDGSKYNYTCDKCDYSTDRLNNISFHYKRPSGVSEVGYKCAGLHQQEQDRKNDIIKQQQTPKSNKRRPRC